MGGGSISRKIALQSCGEADFCVSPDFLGRTEIRIQDILKETRETKGPILKQLILHETDSGEVELKLDLQLFENT